jgi:hypothetical protein
LEDEREECEKLHKRAPSGLALRITWTSLVLIWSAGASAQALTPPTISKAFNPTTIPWGGSSTVTLTLSNSNATALTGGAFKDTLTGMVAIAGPVTGTCTGTNPASLTYGQTTLNFTGINIPANGSCTVQFVVASGTLGVNYNGATGVSTSQTGTGPSSNVASLTVPFSLGFLVCRIVLHKHQVLRGLLHTAQKGL